MSLYLVCTHNKSEAAEDIGFCDSTITFKQFPQRFARCSITNISDEYLGRSHPDHNTHTQLFYGSQDFAWDNQGEPVPEETFTHSHLSWSSVVPYLLHPSITIHGILPVQFTR